MNKFVNALRAKTNYTETENGGVAHKSTLSAVYDMFAFAGAYRTRTDEDCIVLFQKAIEENEALALKCLFYIRDIKKGQGERRFFRVCMHWLAVVAPEVAIRNLPYIADFGRWDDLYCFVDTPVETPMFEFIEKQLRLDIESYNAGENNGISLLAKWLKSENASSKETKALANKTRKFLKLSHKQYRQLLAKLRTRINIVEKLMSENRWCEIQFDKLPAKAGFIYANAFAHKEIIAKKYAEFISSKETKVNAGTLFPYEIVKKVTDKINHRGWGAYSLEMTETERETANKFWENKADHLQGRKSKSLCVIDTSGSMIGLPINVAISLGMYCAENTTGPFQNMFMTFSHHPELIEIAGVDFADKVYRIFQRNQCENTDLTAAFRLIKNTIIDSGADRSEVPESLIVVSDMEIDRQSYWSSATQMVTEMDTIRAEWAEAGLSMPKLVYWNVNARDNIILDGNKDTTFVSGCSPIIFKSILTGKTGEELMRDILESDRYAQIY